MTTQKQNKIGNGKRDIIEDQRVWQLPGLTSEESVYWEKAGFSPELASHWKKYGFTSEEAKEWEAISNGYPYHSLPCWACVLRDVGLNPAEVGRWQDAGFPIRSVEIFQRWGTRMEAAEYQRWALLGLNERDLLKIQRFKLIFSGPEEASRWQEAGFSLRLDQGYLNVWRQFSPDPAEAKAWLRTGLGISGGSTAIELRALGIKVEEVRTLLKIVGQMLDQDIWSAVSWVKTMRVRTVEEAVVVGGLISEGCLQTCVTMGMPPNRVKKKLIWLSQHKDTLTQQERHVWMTAKPKSPEAEAVRALVALSTSASR